MIADTRLRNLKPGDKLYKVNNRDGLYMAVTFAGFISFRYNQAWLPHSCIKCQLLHFSSIFRILKNERLQEPLLMGQESDHNDFISLSKSFLDCKL